MANRFVLNTISYHGSGAIKEIPGELQRRGYKRSSSAPTPIWLSLALPLR